MPTAKIFIQVFVRTIKDEEMSDDFSSLEMDENGSNLDGSDDEENVQQRSDGFEVEAKNKYQFRKKFECKICNKTFTNGHMQKSHMNKHLGELWLKIFRLSFKRIIFNVSANDDPRKKKFQCDLCPKTYFDNNQLRNHKTCHLGECFFQDHYVIIHF